MVLNKGKAFTFANSGTNNLCVIPAGAIPLRFYVNNQITFNTSIGGLSIGYGASVAAFVANMTLTSLGRLDCPLVTAGVSSFTTFASVDTTLTFTLSTDASGATTGAGFIFMDYVQELKA